MDISQKINQIQIHYNLSIREFADRVQLGRGAIQTYVKARPNKPASMPSLEAAVQILKAFPDISPDWFLFDDGPMLKTLKEQPPVNNITQKTVEVNLNFKDKYFDAIEHLNNVQNQLIDCLKKHLDKRTNDRPVKIST